MPDNVEHDTVQARKLSRGGTQFSLRGMFLLTAAFAYWLWLLPDFRREPIAVAVFGAITMAAGIGGHLLHTYLLIEAEPPVSQAKGAIDCRKRLGGLLRYYYRKAA
jgi:hypothetical protein